MITFESSYRTEKKSHDSFIQRFGILQRRKLSEKRCIGDGMKDVIRELNEYAPDLICLRKNCIVRIALYAQQHSLTDKQPKWYIPVSEMVDEMTRSILEKTFGSDSVDAYGAMRQEVVSSNAPEMTITIFATIRMSSIFTMKTDSSLIMGASLSLRFTKQIFRSSITTLEIPLLPTRKMVYAM